MPQSPDTIPQIKANFGSDLTGCEVFFPGDTPCPFEERASFDISRGDGHWPDKLALLQEDPISFERILEIDIWVDGVWFRDPMLGRPAWMRSFLAENGVGTLSKQETLP